MMATWIPTDAQLTEAALYAARRQDRREARRDRERRARLTVWRGSVTKGGDDDDDSTTGD